MLGAFIVEIWEVDDVSCPMPLSEAIESLLYACDTRVSIYLLVRFFFFLCTTTTIILRELSRGILRTVGLKLHLEKSL